LDSIGIKIKAIVSVNVYVYEIEFRLS